MSHFPMQSSSEFLPVQPSMEPNYHTFMSVDVDSAGDKTFLVPQKVYAVMNAQSGFTPQPPIKFSYNGERGVYLQNALRQGFLQGNEQREGTGLLDGNNCAEIVHDAEKITLRIDWPGYQAVEKQIGIKETKDGETRNITNAKLVQSIATFLKQYCEGIRRLRSRNWGTVGYEGWSLEGPNCITFDRLILHELRHVSSGSYQPVILAIINNDAKSRGVEMGIGAFSDLDPLSSEPIVVMEDTIGDGEF